MFLMPMTKELYVDHTVMVCFVCTLPSPGSNSMVIVNTKGHLMPSGL